MDIWGDQFEESIKEKRKLFGQETESAATSRVTSPAKQDESQAKQDESQAKKMTKISSTASLDMFAETLQPNMFNELDVSLYQLVSLRDAD